MRLLVSAAITVVAFAAALLTAPRPADACSCAYDLAVTPANGATDVPTNVVLIVTNRLAGAGAEDIVLEGPDGAVAIEVVVVVDQYAHRLELVRPLEPLAPLVEYQLHVDSVLTVFQTGSVPDAVAPEPVGLGELTLAHAKLSDEIGFSCGDEYSYIDLPITAPADAVAIDVFVDADDVRSNYVVTADHFDWGLSNWNDGCSLRLPVEAGAFTCFEVRARDAAGNLGDPVERCATVTACADIPDPDLFDGDLTGCEPLVGPDPDPPPDSGGCRSTFPTSGLPLAALLLGLLYAVRRRETKRRRLWSMRLVVFTTLVAAAVLATAPRPAHACSCFAPMVIAPADGATDVPTNVVVVLANRSSDLGDPVLTGPDGAVPVEVTLLYDGIETLELVRPLQPLAATSDYTLTLPPADFAFRTGAAADVTRPAPAVLGTLSIAHARAAGQGTSCGDEYLDIDLAITLPADAVAAEVTMRDSDLEIQHVITAERIAAPLGGLNGDCKRNFPLERGHEVCFAVRSRDQAGNLAEPVEQCAQVKACADFADEDLGGDLSDCELATSSAGCSSTSPTAPAPLLLLAFAYAVLLSARRYAVRRRER